MTALSLTTDIEAPIERVELAREPELRARSMAQPGEMAAAGRTAEQVQGGAGLRGGWARRPVRSRRHVERDSGLD